MQLDFVEMLRVRDEKRRMRHVETLRRQKEEEEDDAKAGSGEEGDARVVLLGEVDEEKGSVFKPQPPLKASSGSPSNSNSRTNAANTQASYSYSLKCNPIQIFAKIPTFGFKTGALMTSTLLTSSVNKVTTCAYY